MSMLRSCLSSLGALSLGALATLPLACSGGDGREVSASASASSPTGITSATEASGGTGSSGDTPTQGSASQSPTGSEASGEPQTGGVSASEATATSTTTVTTATTTGEATGSSSSTAGEGSTGPEPAGCQRVDFLFVIDNSSSMEAKQTALKAAFPAFISTIMSTVSAQDYHIMVVDTDATGKCTDNECAKGMEKNEVCNAYICNTEFTECDGTLGAGVVHPAGKASSNKPCDIFGGNRYLLSEDPSLTGTFSCVAKLGLAGNGKERPLDAMVAALAGPINGPKGCNAGFLRDDAILVITMITDDPNKEDMTSPAAAYDAVVAAKNGDVDRVVVLGLIPDPAMDCPVGKPDAGVHWANFIGMFGANGVKGPVCVADYNTFFQEAVAIIEQSCVINPG